MRLLLFLVVVAVAIGIHASPVQQSGMTEPQRNSTQAPTAGMNAPQPAQEMQALTKALAGSWSTSEKYEATFLTPSGGEGHGKTVFRPGPGGFTLKEEYHSQTPAGELFGFGIIWWDSTKGFQHLWCINIYPTGCEMFPPPPQPGPQWDGKRLVLHVESEQNGKKEVFHEVISDITATSFMQTAEVGEAGGPLKRWFTIQATKMPEGNRPPKTPNTDHP